MTSRSAIFYGKIVDPATMDRYSKASSAQNQRAGGFISGKEDNLCASSVLGSELAAKVFRRARQPSHDACSYLNSSKKECPFALD